MGKRTKSRWRFVMSGTVCITFAAVLAANPVTSRTAAPLKAAAFVEPALLRGNGEQSVIVTARTSQQAAAGVRRHGGVVTSELWIVNAVAARLMPHAIGAVAREKGIVSIVENKRVRASDWNGWVSDIRLNKGAYTTVNVFYAPPTHLPNGGFSAVTSGGEFLLVNPDGTEKKRLTLTQGGPFYTPIVVSPSGTMFVAGVYGVMYAISADGSILWINTQNLNTNFYYAPGVIGKDGTLYVVSYYGVVFAFDPATGIIKWQQSVLAKRAAYKTAPVLGPDDTVYLSSDQGDVYAVTAAGIRWSAALNSAVTGNYPGATPFVASTAIYVASGARLVGFDITSGAIRVNLTADGTLLGSPIMAPDGGILVASGTTLYSVAPTGQLQWSVVSPSGSYTRPPLLSADGATVFIQGQPPKGKRTDYQLALARSNGSLEWSYASANPFVAQSAIDPDGGILIVDSSTSLFRLAGDSGQETNRIKIKSSVVSFSQASDTGNVILQLGTTPPEIDFIGRLPNGWNGRKDVETTDRGYRLMYPVSVDVGADTLHKKPILGSSAFIRGGDVAVAVVDSGVYWDSSTKSILGVQLQHQFIGQADYIQAACPAVVTGCTQYSGYAFYDYTSSQDTYGHGSHVAGTISNKLLDDGTGTFMGIAPDARILSVRVLNSDGSGTYETVINGIQYVVANKATYGIRVLNLSLSAYATVPYYVDPLDRAVEKAWQSGIVVVAAAGNTGPFAQSITVPGNDPYVITVGAVNSARTSGFWKDDTISWWSATGPTYDGFAKPEVLAPGSQIVSYMYNDPTGLNTPTLVRLHPDYSTTATLFRMNGTSMATAVASGVVALMIQVNPTLTPNQLKYRLMASSRWGFDHRSQQPVYNTFQQGLGRVWAVDAVLANVDSAGASNLGMNLDADLAHGYATLDDLGYHYQGPVRRMLSSNKSAYLYYATDSSGTTWGLGVSTLDGHWLDFNAATQMTWAGTQMTWAGGLSWSGDPNAFSSTQMTWAGTQMTWAGTQMTWAGTHLSWAGTQMTWAGGLTWSGGTAWSSTQMTWAGSNDAYAVTRLTWAQSIAATSSSASSVRWIPDNWMPPLTSGLPPPAGARP